MSADVSGASTPSTSPLVSPLSSTGVGKLAALRTRMRQSLSKNVSAPAVPLSPVPAQTPALSTSAAPVSEPPTKPTPPPEHPPEVHPQPVVATPNKEAPALSITVERPAVDLGPGSGQIEMEPEPEMPPEVDGFLQTVEAHHDQIPDEIVIANPQSGEVLPKVMAQPVIVLPITPEVEKHGRRKSVSSSVRWLVEWSWKMMKIFSGKVVYRKADEVAA